ncbi:MAG: AI-2E family transporter, partial [Prochlorothrix sp.]
IQNLESYWLTPTVMAKQVSLLPALTLIAQIFFATVFGLLGLILALPLAVVAKVWIQELLVRDILDSWDRSPNLLH